MKLYAGLLCSLRHHGQGPTVEVMEEISCNCVDIPLFSNVINPIVNSDFNEEPDSLSGHGDGRFLECALLTSFVQKSDSFRALSGHLLVSL